MTSLPPERPSDRPYGDGKEDGMEGVKPPTWHGRHGPGAMREHKANKRREAEARKRLTDPERRRSYRRVQEKLTRVRAQKVKT